jgi:sortase A
VRLARVLGAVGRTFIVAGLLILAFVAYQLWGTGIRQAQSQRALERDFAVLLEEAQATTTTTSTTTTTAPEDPPPTTAPAVAPPIEEPPPLGAPVARIQIPAIGVDEIVIEGVTLDHLKRGPGHFPETPLPGQAGNAAIAGHRTTWGAPFHRVDELVDGDEIIVETLQGEFRYEVSGTQIVKPHQVEVLDDFGDARLTLTACHPKYSARERIVVTALLAGDEEPLPPPPPPPADPADPADPAGDAEPEPAVLLLDDVAGEAASSWPAVLVGLLAAAIWLAAWLVGRAWRRIPTYLIATPVFLVALFFFFEEFSRLLPPGY